jgi:hypothetical protein
MQDSGNRFWKVGYHPLYYFLWPPLQFLGEQHEYGWPGFLGFRFSISFSINGFKT